MCEEQSIIVFGASVCHIIPAHFMFTMLSHTFVLFSSILQIALLRLTANQALPTQRSEAWMPTQPHGEDQCPLPGPLPTQGSAPFARPLPLQKGGLGAWERVISSFPTPSRNSPGHATPLVPSKCLNKAPRQVQVPRLFVGRPSAQFACDWQAPNS